MVYICGGWDGIMNCPKCGRMMGQGAPHDDEWVFQWECYCGEIIGVPAPNFDDEEPYP